jgi:hypothetical protein
MLNVFMLNVVAPTNYLQVAKKELRKNVTGGAAAECQHLKHSTTKLFTIVISSYSKLVCSSLLGQSSLILLCKA